MKATVMPLSSHSGHKFFIKSILDMQPIIMIALPLHRHHLFANFQLIDLSPITLTAQILINQGYFACLQSSSGLNVKILQSSIYAFEVKLIQIFFNNYSLISMPKKGMTMRMIADQIAAIRIEDRYFDLCSWELYQLTPNEKKSKATQYKIHFMPYKNRICENLLKRYLTDDSIEFELDKMHKIDEGVYKGEELENYEKCHIVLLLLINKDILNKLRISDLVRRIARFIARTPSYIERCLSNFSKWFVPSDYGIMDDQQEEGDEDEDEDEEEEEDKENKRLLEGEGRNRSETPQRTQSNNVGTNQTSARIMLSAFRKWNTSIILPIKDKFCIEVVGKHPEIEEAKHQIDYLEQERKTKRGLVAERLNMVNKCKGI